MTFPFVRIPRNKLKFLLLKTNKTEFSNFTTLTYTVDGEGFDEIN